MQVYNQKNMISTLYVQEETKSSSTTLLHPKIEHALQILAIKLSYFYNNVQQLERGGYYLMLYVF